MNLENPLQPPMDTEGTLIQLLAAKERKKRKEEPSHLCALWRRSASTVDGSSRLPSVGAPRRLP